MLRQGGYLGQIKNFTFFYFIFIGVDKLFKVLQFEGDALLRRFIDSDYYCGLKNTQAFCADCPVAHL